MALDVRPDHMAMIRAILQARLPGVEVWAFGSRVTGGAKPTSDLDIAVIGETPLTFEMLAHLRDDFSESDLPFKVDIIDWTSTNEAFRAIIRKSYVVLQPSNHSRGKTNTA